MSEVRESDHSVDTPESQAIRKAKRGYVIVHPEYDPDDLEAVVDRSVLLEDPPRYIVRVKPVSV